MTQRRVVPPETHHAEVRTPNGKSYPVLRLPNSDNQNNIVLISIDIPPERVNPIAFTGKVPKLSERVVTFRLVGNEQQPVEGTVSAIEESSSGKVLRIVATLSRDSEGAPVFDTSGELVGIADVSNAEAPTITADAGDSLHGLVPVLSEKAAEMARIVKPKPLNSPMPQYTDLARHHGVQGAVTIRVLIGEDGKVIQAKLIKGLPDGLDDEALKAAYRLKFKPATLDGKPVKYWMPVLVEFKLGR